MKSIIRTLTCFPAMLFHFGAVTLYINMAWYSENDLTMAFAFASGTLMASPFSVLIVLWVTRNKFNTDNLIESP